MREPDLSVPTGLASPLSWGNALVADRRRGDRGRGRPHLDRRSGRRARSLRPRRPEGRGHGARLDAAEGEVEDPRLYRSCTYTVKTKSITVLTRPIARESDFVKSAKANPGVVLPIRGIGADACSAAAGKALLVWENGIEITFSFTGVNPFVATQQALAKTAVGRL